MASSSFAKSPALPLLIESPNDLASVNRSRSPFHWLALWFVRPFDHRVCHLRLNMARTDSISRSISTGFRGHPIALNGDHPPVRRGVPSHTWAHPALSTNHS
jgi:hypothetical protein